MNKKAILIAAGLVGAIGVTSVASAMEFDVYGSIRAGVHIPTSDDAMTSNHGTDKRGVAVAETEVQTQEDDRDEGRLFVLESDTRYIPTANAALTVKHSDGPYTYTPTGTTTAMTVATIQELVTLQTAAETALATPRTDVVTADAGVVTADAGVVTADADVVTADAAVAAADAAVAAADATALAAAQAAKVEADAAKVEADAAKVAADAAKVAADEAKVAADEAIKAPQLAYDNAKADYEAAVMVELATRDAAVQARVDAVAAVVVAETALVTAEENLAWANEIKDDRKVVNPTPQLTLVEGTTGWNWGVGNAGDRIGIKGTQDLGNGMSAGFVFERGTDNSGALNRRHQNAWIKAGWGKLTLGQQGNPYRSVANWDQSYWLGGSAHSLGGYNVDGGSRLNGIRYDGGSGPFSISVMGTAAANDEGQSAYKTRVNAVNGTTIDQNNHIVLTHPEVERVDGIDSIVVAAHYNLGSATINLGLRTNSLESNELDSEYSNTALSANGSAGALDWYVGYAMNSDNYTAPSREDIGTVAGTAGADYVSQRYVAQDATTLGLFLSWGLSERNAVYLEYEGVTQDGTDAALGDLGLTATLLGYWHTLGPNTTFFAEYASRDTESDLTADSNTILAVVKVDF